MANVPSYWTLNQKRAKVCQQLESSHTVFACECSEAYEDNIAEACNRFPTSVEEHFVDCESSFTEPEKFRDSLDSDNSKGVENNLESNLATWELEENITSEVPSSITTS